MKKTLIRSLALAAVGSLMVAGSAMAIPSDYFTTTDFTTGSNGTIDATVTVSGSATFGIYWINDINLPVVSTISNLDIGFSTAGDARLSWTADGANWDVLDEITGITANDKTNVFGFYFNDGSNYYYTDSSISGTAVTIDKVFGNTFKFSYRGNQAVMTVKVDDVSPVPEPATMFLLGTGLVGLAGVRRRKARK